MERAGTTGGLEVVGQLAAQLRREAYRERTVEAYVWWFRRFLSFHAWTHPRDLEATAVQSFLTHELQVRRLSRARVHQALAALVWMYQRLGLVARFRRLPRRSTVSPPCAAETTLESSDVERVRGAVSARHRLMMDLIRETGLSLSACLGLRVEDVDLAGRRLRIAGTGSEKMLSGALAIRLEQHLAQRRRCHTRDLSVGAGWVQAPAGRAGGQPHWHRAWCSQWVFASSRVVVRGGERRRTRSQEHRSTFARALRKAGEDAGIGQPITTGRLRRARRELMAAEGLSEQR